MSIRLFSSSASRMALPLMPTGRSAPSKPRSVDRASACGTHCIVCS
ncbi:Uncharacterised protein [Bordetella pertussis]|nr:Uncharacterised protein [Bordetella pertussis]